MQGQGDGGLAAVGATVQTLRPPRRRSFDLLAPLAVLVTWAYTMQTVGLRSGGCRAEAPGGALGTPSPPPPGASSRRPACRFSGDGTRSDSVRLRRRRIPSCRSP